MLELLLKYDPALFAQGSIALGWPWTTLAICIGLAALLLATLTWLARRAGAAGQAPGLVTSMSLRGLAIALVLFALAGPMLHVEVEEPVRATAAILVDDSLSMRIDDLDGRPRADFARQALADESGSLLDQLRTRFDTQLFAFGPGSQPVSAISALLFRANATHLGSAITSTLEALGDEDPAAVVILSDGADNASAGQAASLEAAILELRRRNIPVYPIRTAPPEPDTDLELSGVRLPARVLAGDTIRGRAMLNHHGLGGQQVRLAVEHEGRILHEQTLNLPPEGEPAMLELSFDAPDSGHHQLDVVTEVIAPGQSPEQRLRNNRVRTVLNVDDRAINVLHYEGEPRFEVKFLRRAVHGDDHIRLVSLVRTAENKHYRLGIESPSQLEHGFPATAAELFAFDVVVLGSVAQSELDESAQTLLADFVARRGGGLVALGGHRSFARGGFAGRPLAKILPVDLEPPGPGPRARPGSDGVDRRDDNVPAPRMVRVSPTPVGRNHELVRQLRPVGGDSAADPWARLPSLTVVNPMHRVKAGATMLLAGEAVNTPKTAGPLSVLAVQRYGRGRVTAFAVRDSWRWQINRDIEPEDQTHETLWRTLLRWAAASGAQRLSVEIQEGTNNASLDQSRSEASIRGVRLIPAGLPASVVIRVLDANFEPANPDRITAKITTPLGDVERRTLAWDGNVPGLFRTTVATGQPGSFEIQVEAEIPSTEPGEAASSTTGNQGKQVRLVSGTESEPANTGARNRTEILSGTAYFQTAIDGREHFGTHTGRELLEHLANQTGGRYFDADDIESNPELLARAIQTRGSTRMVDRQLPLWDMPVIALTLLLLLCLDWILRRRYGLK